MALALFGCSMLLVACFFGWVPGRAVAARAPGSLLRTVAGRCPVRSLLTPARRPTLPLRGDRDGSQRDHHRPRCPHRSPRLDGRQPSRHHPRCGRRFLLHYRRLTCPGVRLPRLHTPCAGCPPQGRPIGRRYPGSHGFRRPPCPLNDPTRPRSRHVPPICRTARAPRSARRGPGLMAGSQALGAPGRLMHRCTGGAGRPAGARTPIPSGPSPGGQHSPAGGRSCQPERGSAVGVKSKIIRLPVPRTQSASSWITEGAQRRPRLHSPWP